MSDLVEPVEQPKAISTLPQWHAFMKPLLEVLSDGNTWSKKDLEQATLDRAGTTPIGRTELLPSGQYRALNRIGWATSYLARAQALVKPARAVMQITDTGRNLLTQYPDGFGKSELAKIPAYQEYVPQRGRIPGELSVPATMVSDIDEDPTELIEAGVEAFAADAAVELIRRLREQHPDFFEQAVVDVLNKMGYGGTEQRGRRLGGGPATEEWTASSTRTLWDLARFTCRRSATGTATLYNVLRSKDSWEHWRAGEPPRASL